MMVVMVILIRFLYEEGSPANQYYKKCVAEMRAEVAQRDGGTEADTEDADGKCCPVHL